MPCLYLCLGGGQRAGRTRVLLGPNSFSEQMGALSGGGGGAGPGHAGWRPRLAKQRRFPLGERGKATPRLEKLRGGQCLRRVLPGTGLPLEGEAPEDPC